MNVRTIESNAIDLSKLQKDYPLVSLIKKDNWDIMLTYNHPDWKCFWTMLPFERMIKEIDDIIKRILRKKN